MSYKMANLIFIALCIVIFVIVVDCRTQCSTGRLCQCHGRNVVCEGNSLRAIPEMDAEKEIFNLFLKHNAIAQLTDDMLTPFTSLKFLDLREQDGSKCVRNKLKRTYPQLKIVGLCDESMTQESSTATTTSTSTTEVTWPTTPVSGRAPVAGGTTERTTTTNGRTTITATIKTNSTVSTSTKIKSTNKDTTTITTTQSSVSSSTDKPTTTDSMLLSLIVVAATGNYTREASSENLSDSSIEIWKGLTIALSILAAIASAGGCVKICCCGACHKGGCPTTATHQRAWSRGQNGRLDRVPSNGSERIEFDIREHGSRGGSPARRRCESKDL